jgi:hypothetical protein
LAIENAYIFGKGKSKRGKMLKNGTKGAEANGAKLAQLKRSESADWRNHVKLSIADLHLSKLDTISNLDEAVSQFSIKLTETKLEACKNSPFVADTTKRVTELIKKIPRMPFSGKGLQCRFEAERSFDSEMMHFKLSESIRDLDSKIILKEGTKAYGSGLKYKPTGTSDLVLLEDAATSVTIVLAYYPISDEDIRDGKRRAESQLISEAGRGYLWGVEKLLDEGVDMNCQIRHLNGVVVTPVSAALGAKSLDVAEFLIEKGANPYRGDTSILYDLETGWWLDKNRQHDYRKEKLISRLKELYRGIEERTYGKKAEQPA